MAATLQQQQKQQQLNESTTSTVPNPQLKRIVYSKYRELLGSYNNKANAIIDSLPSYMVYEDRGFQFEPPCLPQNSIGTVKYGHEIYGTGQQSYEAPACVQNAMMTKDKKPFTYTPGGLDLSQIKSERMAKRLARNAQAEGATGHSQMNRPSQSQSPGQAAAGAIGAAGMGMPFQVLPPPPPPPPSMGKQTNGCSSAIPPPPPAQHTLNTATLAPSHTNGGSPSPARKSPSPATQRFEPPPMGFRPEIKIPPNPMASLRKVPAPVEKNTFWKDAYIKERSKSPMPGDVNEVANNDEVDSHQTLTNNSNGLKMPAANNNYNNGNNNSNNNNYNNSYQQYGISSPTIQMQAQQPQAQQQQQQQQQQRISSPALSQSPQSLQKQNSLTRSEFRSVVPPQSPIVNVYTSPTVGSASPQRATESPFRFAQHSKPVPPQSTSPLAQEPTQPQQQPVVRQQVSQASVPWRTQRAPITTNNTQQQQQQQQYAASPPTPKQQQYVATPPPPPPQQQQQQPTYVAEQESKPTNVGSLYIAPLAPPTEPQAQHIVRQMQQQQQQQQRDSPARQIAQQQQQGQSQVRQAARWMTSQPPQKEQAAWVRPDEPGNIVPSSLQRIKSPPPPQVQQQQQHPMQQQYKQPQAYQQQAQQQQHDTQNYYQPQLVQGNGFNSNIISAPASTGLRLQVNPTLATNSHSQNAPKERIIPIQMEQTPTYTPTQLNFNMQTSPNGVPAGYIIRNPNHFVDQGYNNFPVSQTDEGSQRVVSPNQQLNAPRLIQQQQQHQTHEIGGIKTRIIPISVEGDGTGGPISRTPIILQNGSYNIYVHDCPLEAEIRYRKNLLSDVRTTPVQSKSFRVLQKITDTTDGVSSQNDNFGDFEAQPQLQRPQYARQMSGQQTNNTSNNEQMRRMHIGQEPQKKQQQANRFNHDGPQKYVHPSEQTVIEPKIYTGSAIPSRTFKILQAITTPENADKNSYAEMEDVKLNENQNQNYHCNESINECHNNISENSKNNFKLENSKSEQFTEPKTTTHNSSSSINSDTYSSSIDSQATPPYYSHYAYPYPWAPQPPPPPQNCAFNQNCAPVWPYAYPVPYAIPTSPIDQTEKPTNVNLPPLAYYYSYYPPPYPIPPHCSSVTNSQEFDPKVFYPYPPPPAPYMSYPYPLPPSYTASPTSSRASSALPDIIITPSTEDVPSKIIFEHKIKVQKETNSKSNIEIEEIACKADKPSRSDSKVIDVNLNKIMLNEGKPNSKEGIVVIEDIGSDTDSESSSDDSEMTPTAEKSKKIPSAKLQTIKSVSNIQVYNKKPEVNSDDEEDSDVTTKDGDSDVFESESEEEEKLENLSVIYEESDLEQIGHHELDRSRQNFKNGCTNHKLIRNSKDTLSLAKSLSLNSSSIYDLTKIDNEQIISAENRKEKKMSQINSYSSWKTDIPINVVGDITEHINDTEEYDIIASLRATKLQTQKIMEDSASFWGNSVEIATCSPTSTASEMEINSSYWSPKASENGNNKIPLVDKTLDCKRNTIEEAKNNFWSTVAAAEESDKNQSKTQNIDTDFWAMIENSKDDDQWIIKKEDVQCSRLEGQTAELVQYTNIATKMALKQLPHSQGADICFSTNSDNNNENGMEKQNWDSDESEDLDDSEYGENIQEEIIEDIDESEEEVEDDEEIEEEESEESDEEEENETELKFEDTIEESNLPKSFNSEEHGCTEEPEIDFWAEIERSREKSPIFNLNTCSEVPKNIFVQRERFDPTEYPEETREVATEEETNFVVVENSREIFDPTKYPEEPREVDTDEEIDFWAEIEGSRRESEDHINFHKAAIFWSKKEDDEIKNQFLPNPIFESPLIEKKFDSCELEYYKGEEPIFLNSNTLEEQIQGVEDQIKEHKNNGKLEKEEENDEEKKQQRHNTGYNETKRECPIEPTCENNEIQKNSEEKEEVGMKRSNYRKAMAFFSNPIDENKEKVECSAKGTQEYSPKLEIANSVSKNVQNNMQCKEKSHSMSKELEISRPSNKKDEIENKSLKKNFSDLGVDKYYEEKKISVRARISAFESVSIDKDDIKTTDKYLGTTLSAENYSPTANLSRNSSQRSESEVEEEDSGVTDMNRQLSETDTESESFPELRKMSSYQRASTHSRLFKLLQQDDVIDSQQFPDEIQSRPSRRKIVHNVSITRRQNPTVLNDAETMVQRRERLSLPLQNNKSIDADNPSTPNSPASPILGNPARSNVVSDKLVKELVQSLLLRSDSSHFKDLPMAKLQAAAKRALEEELDSSDNTHAVIPNNVKPERNYDDFYDTWSNATAGNGILPSKAFRVLQEKPSGRKSPWSARCPRVLSSKTVNSDLARVTESPEIVARNNNSPLCFSRESSINRWRKP